jgi:hypothetical protein
MDSPLDLPLDLQAPLLSDGPGAAPGDRAPVAHGTVDSGAGPRPDYFLPELCRESRGYRRLWVLVALAIIAAYAFVNYRFFAAADEGVDQNAYLVGGRLLAEHFSLKYTLPNPYAYTGGMFVRMTPVDSHGNPVPGGDYFPKYPFGLPLLYACFIWAFKVAGMLPILKHHVDPAQGVYWAFIVSPVSAVLGVAGVFYLARLVAGSFAGVLAAILLASSQLMMMLSENPNSHASCMAFIVWGFFLCLRWMQTGSLWRGILGGLLVGYAATIRYNEGVLFIPMCLIVLSRWPWNQLKSWRSLTAVIALLIGAGLIYLQVQNAHAAVAGTEPRWTGGASSMVITAYMILLLYGISMVTLSILRLEFEDWMMYLRSLTPGLAWAVPVGVLMAVNYHTMGSFAGYDTTHESEFGVGFQWKFFWENWEKVVRSFYDMGLFFVVPFAVAGLVMVFRRSVRIGLILIAWLVPGVMLYMSYYWSMDFADAYARFFLTYLPVLLVGAAVCFTDGILLGGKETVRSSRVILTLATGVVVAIAAGVSMYRTVHGLRDGQQSAKIPLHEFRQRLALAQTGQMLLANVPEKSVLFTQDTGGIATPANYIQFLRNWELYSINAFSLDGSRQGMGGGGNRPRNNGRNNRDRNNGAGRGNFNGGGNFGGPPNGGNNGPNGQNDTTTAVATPQQPEQREYKASLYRNMTPVTKLYRLEADVINQALAQNRKVFVVVAKQHAEESENTGGFNFFGNNNNSLITDPLESFRDDLGEVGKYQYKVITRWQDVALPADTDDDNAVSSNNPMGGGPGGGGGRNGGNMMLRMLTGTDRVMDWQLVEVLKK